MKITLGFALVILLALGFSLTRSSAEDTQSVDMRLYPPTTIEWKAGPAALPPGARMAVLEGDPTKEGPFVVRFQFPEGYHVPPHTHPKTERVTVISGILYLATGEALDRTSAKKLPAGSFGYWPAGMKHTAWSEDETVIQLHGMAHGRSTTSIQRTIRGTQTSRPNRLGSRYNLLASSCAFSRSNSAACFICSFSVMPGRASS